MFDDDDDDTPHLPASLDDVLDQLERHREQLERISEWVQEISHTLNDASREKELNNELIGIGTVLYRIRESFVYLSIVATVGFIGVIATLGTLRHWF